MASLKAVILAGVVAIGAFGAAHAADLDLPPPPPVEPPPVPVPVASGWYLRGDVGVGFDQLDHFSSNAAATVPGYGFEGAGLGRQVLFGGGVGYQFNNWFRFDVTGEYRTATKYWAQESYTTFCTAGPVCYDDDAGRISTFDVLANGYVDLGTWWNFTPFVGAGVGGAFSRFSGLTDVNVSTGGSGSAPDSSSTNFAWALMAGVDYSFAPNWKLELSYRYFDGGRIHSGVFDCGCGEVESFHLYSHDVRLGLRYMFAEIPPIAPPLPPVVAKY